MKKFNDVLDSVLPKERKMYSARIPVDLIENLKRYAARKNISEAKLLEAILIWFLEQEE